MKTLWTILGEAGPNTFRPDEATVLEIEAQLPAVLAEIGPSLVPKWRQPDPFWLRLDDYRRQYYGIVRDGERYVIGNVVSAGFCGKGDAWRTEPIAIEDGGTGILYVTYHVESRLFVGVESGGWA